MKPPAEIDGAQVLWWAWSGDEPFGIQHPAPVPGVDPEYGPEAVYGFAVCRYASGVYYRFSCDADWETVNDTDHADAESAKASIPPNYDASRVVWQRFEP